jgi:hypothetical protein|nr:MAG: hypothetical protein [Bacteriophage sp.]
MRDFFNYATTGSGGASLTGAATGQITIAIVSLAFMVAFGLWGAYLRWRDSKVLQEDSRALREALENGDLTMAFDIRSKR